jgi:RNA 3'-terminal phosphate cyclase (ATP)
LFQQSGCKRLIENITEITSAFGETNVTAEKVGKRGGKHLTDFIGSNAAVGRHLADQLLLPLALAGGGSFTTMVPDDHVTTNLQVIESFLPIRSSMEEMDRGLRIVRFNPC